MINNENEQNPFSLIADFEGDESHLFDIDLGSSLPIMPLRNMVLFPGVVMPVSVARKSSLRLIKQANKKNWYVGVTCQIQPETERPQKDDLYAVGTVAKILKLLEMPDQSVTVILQGMCRFQLDSIIETEPFIAANITKLPETLAVADDKEYNMLVDTCKDATIEIIKKSEQIQKESVFAVKNISNKMSLINFICANLPFSIQDKNKLLAIGDVKQRGFKLLSILNKENDLANIKANILKRTKSDLDEQQKEYFLHQQIKTIQDELGGTPQDQDMEDFIQKAFSKIWPENIAKTVDKEIKKLERLNPQSPDYNVQYNYLQTVLSLPWGKCSEDNLDINNARRVLDKDHYGLEKVKERILEHIAILKLKRNFKSPIICLYGPPGVGKTSLGRSIAKALKREYVRVSLGGIHDESEIRGHRKTYIGAMPGRIIKSIIKAGTSNPVMVLDEIDKIGESSNNGDPSSALLEVLDPEQNVAFHDNFLDMDYDLSNVLFIATANNIGSIPRPLLDRLELIEVSGYLTEEKMEIAKRHLVPKEKENTGLESVKEIKFNKAALEFLIEKYTRESGVRQLDKQINKIFRKMALELVTHEDFPCLTIKPADIEKMIGKPLFTRDIYQGNQYAGVVTGLAWTSVGGEILFIESSLSKGHGSKLTLTGNLGDVMKESAVIALEYIKAHAEYWNIDTRIFDQWNVHVHVPEGATPKDGPSAGITIVTSLISAITQRKVRANVAMTGEITLRGKVLPVGGIKEKILAAKRAGITDIVICNDNKKDIEEIPAKYVEGLTFHYVEDITDVQAYALLDEKVEHPIDISYYEEKKEDDNKK